ncbi:MAG: hypothetical protein WD071_15900 [Pseudohongiella sp.]|uniref:helix-turn-helix transcriptional regulator n=1 Tax=Pseudohongiella sp. TaxID=1979412 RepID=UPI0034A000F5
MPPIQLKLGLSIDADTIDDLSRLIRQIIQRLDRDAATVVDSVIAGRAKMTPTEASRQAIFAGQKPPTDRGLLVDSHEVAKLLKVSERTIYKMHLAGEMPPR